MRASKTDDKDDFDGFLEEVSKASMARDASGPLRLLARLLRGGSVSATRVEEGGRPVSRPPMDAGVTRGTTLWF